MTEQGGEPMEGKIALVSGATSGIGRAVALRLAEAGATLFLGGRDEAELDVTAAAVRDRGRSAAWHRGDLAEPPAADALVAAAVAAYGQLDVLVNAAGIIGNGTIENTDDASWAAMMAINVDAVFRLTRAAVPHLKATRGAVVNVSSVTGVRAFPGVLAYCVSKAAVDQLTRCAALELAPDGVRVNAVNPGVVVSQLHRRSGMDEAAYAAFLEHSNTTHPLGRVGHPDDIANAVLFLASAQSDWITGETLSVDGGRHQTCAR
jgi:NAD(P)-dependent dehydrogenase (short-subunit alcohol dehydrogenase family)